MMMPNQLVECVPNFSEGQDEAKIAQIADAVTSVPGIELLHVDAGWDMNRTVITFLGQPAAVAEAAFRAMEKAAQVIDMSLQKGTHPRIGATDVFPFVPIEGVTLAECAEIARQVARRVGEELKIPVYLYEAAATTPERANLATIRKGEYEGLAEKMKDPRWKPDFGPAAFNPRSGATVVGAREFLIAYNITLNTRDKEAAADIALELRERGRVARSKTSSPYYHHGEMLHYRVGHFPCGNCDFVGKTFLETEEHCRSEHDYELPSLAKEEFADPAEAVGKKVRRAGKFKFCKAIGWYAEAFRRAQISINLTNFHVTPPHLVLEEARKLADERGLIVTGSEIVGMIPFTALFEAGKYYLQKQGASTDVPILEILETAVFSMGLRDVQHFEIGRKVIGLPREIADSLPKTSKKRLVDKKIYDFVKVVASNSSTPAGGCVASLAGSLGAALATMAAKIAQDKLSDAGEKDDVQRKNIARIVETAHAAEEKLLFAIDEDAASFEAYLHALRLPAKCPEETEIRIHKIQEALRQAIEVPYRTAVAGFEAMQAAHEIAVRGPASTLADAAAGVEIAFAATLISLRNISANLQHCKDAEYVNRMHQQCATLQENVRKLHEESEQFLESNGI